MQILHCIILTCILILAVIGIKWAKMDRIDRNTSSSIKKRHAGAHHVDHIVGGPTRKRKKVIEKAPFALANRINGFHVSLLLYVEQKGTAEESIVD